MGLAQIIGIIASSIGAIFGFFLTLIFGAQIGGNAGLYGSLPATNITKITTNVGNAVVSGSGFTTLIFLGSAAAFTLGLVGLVILGARGLSGGRAE